MKIFVCHKILLPQQVAENQISLNLCDLLWGQNSFAEKKFSQKFSSEHKATCCYDALPRHVAATCRLVCTFKLLSGSGPQGR